MIGEKRWNIQVWMTITMKGNEVGSAMKLDWRVADCEGSVTRISIQGAHVDGTTNSSYSLF